jgi:hypothetical protein
MTDLRAVQPRGWPGQPRLLSGGLVVYAGDPIPTSPTNVIAFQYNPDTVSRTLQPRGTQPDPRGNAGDTQHLTLPEETFGLTIELEATDQLEIADSDTMRYGLHPSLLALELLLYPGSGALTKEFDLERQGSATVAPGTTPMVLMVWSASRVTPVRLTSLHVTEQAFDTNLNPIRASVEISMRSLTVRELVAARSPWDRLVIDQVRQKEQLAARDLRSQPASGLRSIAREAGAPG